MQRWPHLGKDSGRGQGATEIVDGWHMHTSVISPNLRAGGAIDAVDLAIVGSNDDGVGREKRGTSDHVTSGEGPCNLRILQD